MSEKQEDKIDNLLTLSDEAFTVFQIAGDLAKLKEAIAHLNLYNEERQPSDDNTIGRLAFKLARCGQALYERSRAPLDISNAISNAEAAIARVPSGLFEADRGVILAKRYCILSKCLVSQGLSKDCERPESLEQAIETVEALKELEALCRTGTDGYFSLLRQKASCKQLLWDRNGWNVEDLDSSVALTFKVLDWSSHHVDNDERAQILGELAARLLRAYTYEHETGQRLAQGTIPDTIYEIGLCDQAISYLSTAEALDVERELTKLDNVILVVDYLHNMPEASQRPLLRKLRWLLQSNVQRLKNIMQTALKDDITAHAEKYFGLPRDAAAAVTEAGADALTALQILEEGRHITGIASLSSWNHLFACRSPCKAETEEYEQLRLQLGRLIEEEAPYEERRSALAALRAFEQSSPWTQIVTLESVSCLASEGPVVVINIANVRSDAYIITTSGVHSVWLPNLKELEVSKLSWKIQWRLAQDTYPDWDKLYNKLHIKTKDMYVHVWRHAMKPILDNLGFQRREYSVTEWPRICWIPTGTLSLYPIGVTGFGLGERGNTFNRVISTYAPSVKALLASSARSSTPERRHVDNETSAAVFAMKKTKGKPKTDVWEHPEDAPELADWGELRLATDEVRIVQHHFPTAEVRFQPTSPEVIETLRKGFSIVYFSCHGWIDYINPSKTMLLFENWGDDPLSVEQISKANICSKIAVMSACSTANSGVEGLQDEPNHVTAALYMAGFQAVVGSLWSVREQDALIFTEELYQYLALHAKDGITTRVVAEAVHVATMKVAQSTQNPAFWSPFVCFGI